MGEPRPTSGAITRFHAGVDVTNPDCKTIDNTIEAIEGGRIATTTPGCESGAACFRITTLDGQHAFDYVHVDLDPSLSNGSIVQAGDLVGEVQDPPGSIPPHLHLNEIQRVGFTYLRINPQRPGALDFREPTDRPTFDTSVTYGGVNEPLILVPEYTGNGADGDQTYTPFRYRSNTYYVTGAVDALISANDGTIQRKGLWGVGLFPQTAGYLYSGQINISMDTLADTESDLYDVKTIYLQRNTMSITFFGMNKKLNGTAGQQATDGAWQTGAEIPGAVSVCAKITDYPQGNVNQLCRNAYIDRSAPTITMTNAGGTVADGGATSTTTITIAGTDSGGIYSIKLEGGVSYSSTNYPSGVQTSAQNTFPDSSGLTDGSYTATVVDLAGNSAQARFTIATSTGNSAGKKHDGSDFGPSGASTTSFFCSWSSPAGIKEVTFDGAPYSFGCPGSTSVVVGPFASLATGGHTCTGETCAGISTSTSIDIYAGTSQMRLLVDSDLAAPSSTAVGVDSTSINVSTPSLRVRTGCVGTFPAFDLACQMIGGVYNADCFIGTGGCQHAYRDFSGLNASITKTTTAATVFALDFTAKLPSHGGGDYSVTIGGVSYQDTATAEIDLSAVGQNYRRTGPDGKFAVNLPYAGGSLGPTSFLPEWLLDILRRVKRTVDTVVESVTGSDLVFTSSGTINFTLTGVTAATDTMRIYQWTSAGWSSGTVTGQVISLSSTGVLSATGTVSTGGYFALLYDGVDSSAPVTGFNIQGSSFVFDTTLFLSTSAYVVFVGTDPAVNGFASGAATSYYRLDPDSTTAYAAYTSSIPVPLGFHTIQYYSVDYAGNAETPKISSFVVTAGSVFRASEGLRAPGGVLAGFLGSGAQAEIVSAAENDYTLVVSSSDASPLMKVSNIGQVGFGMETPAGRVDIQGKGVADEAALLLRSGATSASGARQIEFGYDGEASMRHALRTRHSTATYGNAMDFLVWNPGAGSTTTAANLGVLSIEASTETAGGGLVHVRPAGHADEELVVSDGTTMGGGTIHRAAAYAPSSRRFKSDIRGLSERDEDRALAEIAALNPVVFRYKSDDARQPLRRGLIYEEAPESIRASGNAVSVDERVVELELALKASIRRLEALRARLAELEK